MKVYVIALERFQERYKHITEHVESVGLDYNVVKATDGHSLNPDDLSRHCNMEKVEKLRWWLNNGAIGCVLSHRTAYEDFLKTTEESAFIVEDDVLLPKNINNLLEEISGNIKSDEVILLYYTSTQSTLLSKIGAVQLKANCGLYFPIDISQPVTAAAYAIGRKAAENMLDINSPIEVTADCWHHFYSKGGFQSFRVLFPSPIGTKNFKSSIDYINKNSLVGIVAERIDKYKIPPLHQMLSWRRKIRLNRRLNHFSLSEQVSPIYQSNKEKS